MGSVAAMKVMKGFMIEMMNPLARDDAALITLFDSQHGASLQISSRVMNPFMIELMNPLTCGSVRCPDRQAPDQEGRHLSRISRISSSHEGFDEGFHEPHPSS
jgi:hypothetical protein